MFSRILSSAVVAASLAAAMPAFAHDDPAGPSPDDPSFATWVARPRSHIACERVAPSPDDPSAAKWDAASKPTCVCSHGRAEPSPDDPSAAKLGA